MSDKHQNTLVDLLQKKLLQQEQMTFAQYMEQVLYEPGVGYYMSGLQKFGREGDFVTAPELSPLFAQCLTEQVMEILSAVEHGDVLEFGAGSGRLAADLLMTLAQKKVLPAHYYIVELSGELRQRQRETMTQYCPELLARVVWLDRLPAQPIRGVIIANEVLDAMPVERFRLRDGNIEQSLVCFENDKFIEKFQLATEGRLTDCVKALRAEWLTEVNDYISEVNLNIPAWINAVSDCLNQGLVLLIDYGFLAHEYYHPSRHMGTLMCHYQQRAHGDPFIHVGEQDITAHVDFTAVMDAASNANLQISGFSSQARFLLNCKLLEYVQRLQSDARSYWQATKAVNLLTSPAEMGELFKVLALTRNIDFDLLSFNKP